MVTKDKKLHLKKFEHDMVDDDLQSSTWCPFSRKKMGKHINVLGEEVGLEGA